MQIVMLPAVQDFISTLDAPLRRHVLNVVDLLEEYGHNLGMPAAKPIGQGLWELRVPARPAVRIVYEFYEDAAVLALALKKQRAALSPKQVKLAQQRLEAFHRLR